MTATLTELSQRDEAFWLGLGLFVAGLVLTPSGPVESGGVGQLLLLVGSTILVARLLVGVFRIGKHALVAGRIGYGEGRQ